MSNDNNENIEKELKIILLGECGVGKTNIISRYMSDKFDEDSTSTTSSSYIMKIIKKDNITYRLNIWDTAGQEKYRSVTKVFLQEANIIILVYSIIDEGSFEALEFWYKNIKENCGNDLVIAIAGNKYDLFLEETVDDEAAKKYAKDKNAIFKLVSAKNNRVGIEELFDMCLNEYIKKSSIQNKDKNERITIRDVNKEEKTKKCC